MTRLNLLAATAAAALAAYPAAAQTDPHAGHAGHAPTPTPAPAPQDHNHHQQPEALAHGPHHADPAASSAPASGTARLPGAEGAMRGIHAMSGEWMLMAHGAASLIYTDQGGPRGGDKVFVPSMAMLSADRDLGSKAHLQLRTMLSIDPAMGQRGYPNLFAGGETAHGQPLVDRQHPHDLFMELTARLDFKLGGENSLFLYGGPVGEPAIGPAAFMHRRSARYLPLSPITHHWFDSTHITYGVVTIGFASPFVQIEGSAFKGEEPDERRWGIDTPRLDSFSGRITLTPSANWAVQVSHGRLEEPEAIHPGQDERRTTASIHYADARFSAMLAFGAKDRVPGDTLTAFVAEANWNLTQRHSLFGRIEHVANDELFPDHSHALHDRKFRVTRFEGGYAYRIRPTANTELALGGSLAAYAKPAALDPYYGKSPVSYTLFARFAIGD